MLLTGKPLQLYTTAYSSSLTDFSLSIIEKNTRHGLGVWPRVSLVYRMDAGYGTEGQSDAYPGQYIYNLFVQLLGAGESNEVYNTKTLNPCYFSIIRKQLRYMLTDGSLYRKTEERILKSIMGFRESPGDIRATAELIYQTLIYPKGSLVSARQILKQSGVYKASDFETYGRVILKEVRKRALPESSALIGTFGQPGQGKSVSAVNASLYAEVREEKQIWEQIPGLFVHRQFRMPQTERAYKVHFKKYSEIPEHSIANIFRMISGSNGTAGRREDFKRAEASGGRILSRPYSMGFNLDISGRMYNKDVFDNSRLLLSLKQQTLARNLIIILNDIMTQKLSLQRITAMMQGVAAIPTDGIRAYVSSEALREGSIRHEKDAVYENFFSRTAVMRLHGNITGIMKSGGEVLKTALSLKKKIMFFGGTAATRAEQGDYGGRHAPDLHHAGEGTVRRIFGGGRKNYSDYYINFYNDINFSHAKTYEFLAKTGKPGGVVKNLFRRIIERSEPVIAKILGSRFVPSGNRYVYFTETNKSDNIIAGSIIHLNYLRGALHPGDYTSADGSRYKRGIGRTDMPVTPTVSAYSPADRKDIGRTAVEGTGKHLQESIYAFLKSIGAYYRQNEMRDTGKADSYGSTRYTAKDRSSGGDITDTNFYYTIANHKIMDRALHLVNVRNAGNLRRELEAGGTFIKRSVFTPLREAAYKPEKALRAHAGKPLEGRISGIKISDEREIGKTPLMDGIADTRGMYHVINGKWSAVLFRHRDEGMRLLTDGSRGNAADRIHIESGSRTGAGSYAEDLSRSGSGMNTESRSFTYKEGHTEINRHMQRWLRIITGWNKVQRRAFSYTSAKESSLFMDKYVKTGHVSRMIRNMQGRVSTHLPEPGENGLNLVPARLKPAVGMQNAANAGFASKLFTKGAVLVTARTQEILQGGKPGQTAGIREISGTKAVKLVNLRDYTGTAGKSMQEGSYIRQMPTINHRKSQAVRDRQSSRPKSLNQPAKSDLYSEVAAVKVKKFTDDDIRDVANKVYRQIEQRLRYERRSKGL